MPPGEALIINQRIPFSRDPNPPAHAFRFVGDAEAKARALNCLTQAVYYEAASEPEAGQFAVAQVILNRVRHPTFPKSICAVVYQGSTLPTGCQFTFTCDGSLLRPAWPADWKRAEKIAQLALGGSVFAPVGYATHYHADFVVPYWITSLAKNAVVRSHIFYRWPGIWGRPSAFQAMPAATEANPVILRATALAARRHHGRKPPRPLPMPVAEVDANKAVELLSMVALLADRSPAAHQESAYTKTARERFSPFADHTAVLIYRQLAAEDDKFASAALVQMLRANPASGSALKIPEFKLPGPLDKAGAGFAEALTNFAAVSDFDGFFEEQRPYYASIAAPLRLAAVEVLKSVQQYTGMPPAKARIVVAPLLSRDPPSDCTNSFRDFALLVRPVAGSRAVEPNWASAGKVGDFLRTTLIRDTLSRSACRDWRGRCGSRIPALDPQTEMHLVRSLAARIGEAGEAPTATGPVRATAYLSEAFTSYEFNRKWFTTFADFYPVLLEVIAAAPTGVQENGTARRSRRNSKPRQVEPRKEPSRAEPLICMDL